MNIKISIGILLIFALLCNTVSADDTESYQPEYDEDGSYYMKADGTPAVLINHEDAERPSYNKLIRFLKKDKTDETPYNSDSYDCVDYAEELHNNAEEAGIKCGFVDVNLEAVRINGVLYRNGHQCNCFRTTDKGLVYVDCTQGDWIATVKEGEIYTVTSIYDEGRTETLSGEDSEIIEVVRFW